MPLLICVLLNYAFSDKKRLTQIGLFSAENDAMFECFGIRCDNAYLCNNCKNILVSLYRKFACIKERFMRIISISVGSFHGVNSKKENMNWNYWIS